MSNVVCDTAKGDQQAAASPSFCKRKVQLLAPNQQGLAAIGSFQLTCLAASLGLLLLGFLYYLSITVVIFCWRILLISESMDHHDSEIMDDRSID